MSKLSEALGGIGVPQIQRLRGGARLSSKQTEIGVDPSYAQKSQRLGSLGKIAEMGASAYGAYKDNQKSKADERSDEIIRKLTPEQRREALKNGTLLYQDDPYAMEALKIKTGRNAAFQVDDEVAQKVQRGEFRTRQQLDEYRHEALQKGAKDFAETFGISEADEFFQKGFNSNITDRNISLYGQHDNFLSEQAKKGAVINSRVELGSVLNDPQALRSPAAGEFFESYINNGLVTGSIPSDDQAMTMIQGAMTDVINKDGGTQFLQQIQDRKVTLNGVTSSFKELVGNEQWNNMMVKAQANEYQLNAKRMEDFKLGVNSALNQADLNKGWEQLQAMKARNDEAQPGEEITPERQFLIQAEMQMQDRLNQESAATAKAMDEAQKTVNKQDVIDAQFSKRLGGQYVSTNYKDMPTNENTGEFTHSDMVNYANKKLSDIDNMDIPQEQKDRMKLNYLKADSEGGAFRTAFGELVDDAGKEWSAAVINGKLPNDPQAINQLRQVRNADPTLMAALYPDKAEMFLTLDMMDNMGIDPQILLDADKAMTAQSKEMRFEGDRAWDALKNNSKSPELSRIPGKLDDLARKVYEAVRYRSGNSDMAQQHVDKFLKEHTVTFKGDDVDGNTIGVIPKNSLKVNDDPDSWEQGRDIIDTAAKQIAKVNPWITNGQLMVYEQGDSIYLMATNGQVRIRYDQELMQKVAQDQAQKDDAKARDEELKNANKRARIVKTKAAGDKRRADREKKLREKGGLYGNLIN